MNCYDAFPHVGVILSSIGRRLIRAGTILSSYVGECEEESYRVEVAMGAPILDKERKERTAYQNVCFTTASLLRPGRRM